MFLAEHSAVVTDFLHFRFRKIYLATAAFSFSVDEVIVDCDDISKISLRLYHDGVDAGYDHGNIDSVTEFRIAVEDDSALEAEAAVLRSYEATVIIVPIDVKEISSTSVRETVRRADDISSMVPEGVDDYIWDHYLYYN